MLKKLVALFVITSLTVLGSYVVLKIEPSEIKTEKLYEHMYGSTVQVRAINHLQPVKGAISFSHGTGWIFKGHNNEAFVWTAGHVLASARNPDKTWNTISVTDWMYSNGTQLQKPNIHEAQLVRISSGHEDKVEDLAVLYLPNNLYKSSYSLAEDKDFPKLGDPLSFIGATAGYTNGLFVTEGRLGRREVKMGNYLFDYSTAPAGPGGSGGPIVSRKGKVLGILVGGQTECHTYFISAQRIRDWAKKMNVEYALDRSIPVPKEKGLIEEIVEADFKKAD